MRVSSLGQEDPLEKEMATHSTVLAWEISWTEEPGGLQSVGLQRIRYNLATKEAAWPTKPGDCSGSSPLPGTQHSQFRKGTADRRQLPYEDFPFCRNTAN